MTDDNIDRDRIARISIRRYRQRAQQYDETCGPTWSYREQAISMLKLRAGDVVLDVGCGTGLSLELLRAGVGESGLVIGVEQSPEMARLCADRIARGGWSNVILIQQSAHDVELPRSPDALLFNYTHDICRSELAIENLFRQVSVGARVSMAGVKYFPWWAAPLNVWVYFKNRAYNGNPGELRSPWDKVQRLAPNLDVNPTQLGMGYIASGVVTKMP